MSLWIDKDIQWHRRPAFGYQIILLTPRGCQYWTLYTIVEYRYGSRYSYPAPDEAEARKIAVEYAMQAISDHWFRSAGTGEGTRMEARIYPFGGMIRDMRLVSRRRG